ncbi:MAG: hypothetical protein JXA67_06440, partial [Micromonosporaceae bacterium]|nr:hypothetical protein [Micromonosporaceae bacterium]
YYLQWTMGRQTSLGSELGECLRVARQVEDGNRNPGSSATAGNPIRAGEATFAPTSRILI